MRRPGLLAAVVILGGLMSLGFSQVRMQQIIDRQDHDAEIALARSCVASYASRQDARDMAEVGYRRNAETLVALATSADPARIAAYQEQVERDVDEIRATLPNPDCDLEDAKNLLGEDP